MAYAKREDRLAYAKKHYENNKEYYKTKTRKLNKENKAKNLIWLREFLVKNGCKNCGINDFRVLQFHHRDPNEKSFNIQSRLLSKKNMVEEIEKCDVLCANCHSIEHYELKLQG